MLDDLRQWIQPEAFRIAPETWTPEMRELYERMSKAKPVGSEDLVKMVVDLGTELWRLRQKMAKPGTAEPLEEMRRPWRHVEAMWDLLRQGSVEVQDHTGERFDSGLSLKAIAFQPTPGIDRERVIETVRPSIYVGGQLAQMGEVVVGKPEAAPPAGDQKKDEAGGAPPPPAPSA